MNQLFFGDNLRILRQDIREESVDLIYLDPPFNSNRSYNVLFKSRSGEQAQAQIEAFDDTWTWSQQTEAQYDELVGGGAPAKVADAIQAIRHLLDDNDVLAYLVMMAARLVEMHRVLKRTGSLYLHCDPTASHYLKVLLDAVFGPTRFRTEIIWRRTSAHSDTKQGRAQHGRVHDVILYYSKGDDWTWNPIYTAYSDEYDSTEYRHVAPDGRRYKEADVTAAKPGGDTSFDWRVKRRLERGQRWEADLSDEYEKPVDGWEYRAVRPYQGRYWAYAKSGLIEFAKAGKLIHRSTGAPRLMLFADEMPGVSPQDVWTDIPPIGARAAERLGYPTQKPLALLERIIATSSNEGDVVFDPFCGCGTTIDAAHKLNRRWTGIDITYLAIDLIEKRLRATYGDDVRNTFEVRGVPRELEGAQAMFNANAFEFERWAVSMINGEPNQKQVADRGIDGVIRFYLNEKRDTGEVLVSVKGGGQLNPGMVRDLRGTVERRRAAMGVFICLTAPTPGMVEEAQHSGSYVYEFSGASFPKLQIITVAELLHGKRPAMPTPILPYKLAKRRSGQLDLELD